MKIIYTKENREGAEAFRNGQSTIDNPYVPSIGNNSEPWNWNFGWLDAMAEKVRET
jgi:hypothetical protein|tara:strand:+ start:479 stop:646 length:168 start_codon:yes stop_codon:yes gene_type:complete